MVDRSPVISIAAVHVLKNELAGLDDPGLHRDVLFQQRFILPGGFADRVRQWLSRPGLLATLKAWLAGADRELFRDRCDHYFFEVMAPVIEAELGEVAEPLLNTVNEAIINYAEYSFRRWSLLRRVEVILFKTEGPLGYAIIRPRGSRLVVFDPLELREKSPDLLFERRRGWGHTILMRRALFVSFDKSPQMRGMMIIVGPDGARGQSG